MWLIKIPKSEVYLHVKVASHPNMAEEGIAKTLSLTGTLHQAGNVCHIEEGRHLSMVSEI